MNYTPSLHHFTKSTARQVLLLLWLCFLEAFAGAQELSLRKLGFEDGLSHRNVRCIQQDAKGFLWIGNDKGLNRYDGHEFLLWDQVNTAASLPGGRLKQIVPETERHWLLLYDTLVIAFDPTTSQTSRLAFAEGDSLPAGNFNFNKLVSGSDGAIWLLASNELDSSAWLFQSSNGQPLRKVKTLPIAVSNSPMAAFNGQLYLASWNNVISIIEPNGAGSQSYELPAPVSDPAFSRILGFYSLGDDQIWVFLNSGQIGWIDRKTGFFHHHPISDHLPATFNPSAILIDRSGDLWATGVVEPGTQNVGGPCTYIQPGSALFHYSQKSGNLLDLSYYLKQKLDFTTAPRQLYEDATGGIWLATEFGLVHVIQSNYFQNLLADGNDCCKDGTCSMRGMTEDQEGNIYFCYYDGIHMLRKSTQTLEPLTTVDDVPLNNPFGMLWHKGYLWLGNGKRINLETLEAETMVKKPRAGEGYFCWTRIVTSGSAAAISY